MKQCAIFWLVILMPLLGFGQFSKERIFPQPESLRAFAGTLTIDFDNDGDLDVLGIGSTDVFWFENQGDKTFVYNQILEERGLFRTLAVGDLDNDGDLDIVTASRISVGIILNNGEGVFEYERLSIDFSTSVEEPFYLNQPHYHHIYLEDLDNDLDLDIIFTDILEKRIIWRRNNGNGTFGNQIIIAENFESFSIDLDDFDNDGDVDIFGIKRDGDKVYKFENNGNGNFSLNELNFFDSNINLSDNNYVKLADFDNDNLADILVRIRSGFHLLYNKGNGVWESQKIISGSYPWKQIVVHDLDNDNDLDILITLSSRVAWFENTGNQNFKDPEMLFEDREKSYTSIEVTDIDVDGDTDIIVVDLPNNLYGNQDLLLKSNHYWIENFANNPTIQGVVFYDKNENGIFDSLETTVKGLPISITPLARTTFTDEEGIFKYYVDNGDYTLNINLEKSCWEESIVSNEKMISVDGEIEPIVYFPLKNVNSDSTHTTVHLNSNATRCGFVSSAVLSLENDGCGIANGKLGLILSPLVRLVSTEIIPDTIVGDTLFWNYEDLFPTYNTQIKLSFLVADAEFIGEFINLKALSYIENDQGELELSSTYNFRSEIRCAYDPNDKQVSPNRSNDYDQNYTLFDEQLNYTIRFQNTGNDTAFNIVIRDTLDENLDLSTFRPIIASHPFETTLNQNGLVEFSFKNILLPDSIVNEPLSHGFVSYKISPKSGLSENTVISNTAGIYFDFNPPIITNTIESVMVSALPRRTPVREVKNEDLLRVYPNPFLEQITIEIADYQPSEKYSIHLFDATGKEIISTIMNGNRHTIMLNDIAKGLYFYQVNSVDGQMIGSGKLVK